MEKSFPILFISTVSDGHMGVSAPVNRKKYFAKIGANPEKTVDAIPVHGNKIKIVTEKDGGKNFPGFDGIITKSKELILGLTCADCMPIAFFNPVEDRVGLAHCGWRGLENGIIKNMAVNMGKKSLVFIGPHVCKDHYRINLASLAKRQLIDSGIDAKNIQIDSRCTFEDKELFSYRRGDTKNRNLYLYVKGG